MGVTRWDERFFASTRGQVVTLLRRGRRTVDELAGTPCDVHGRVTGRYGIGSKGGLPRVGRDGHGFGHGPGLAYPYPGTGVSSDADRR